MASTEEKETEPTSAFDPINLTVDGLQELLNLPPNELPRLPTAPTDPRFPDINKTRACWQNYVDWLRCIKLRDEEDPACRQVKRLFTILCPSSWVERWEGARGEGVSPHVAFVERMMRERGQLPSQ